MYLSLSWLSTDTVMYPLISIILKMLTIYACVQFSVASRLTLYKSSCVVSEFMVMLPFSIQRGYNGNGIGYQKGSMRMLHGTYQVYTLDGQLNVLFIHLHHMLQCFLNYHHACTVVKEQTMQ